MPEHTVRKKSGKNSLGYFFPSSDENFLFYAAKCWPSLDTGNF